MILGLKKVLNKIWWVGLEGNLWGTGAAIMPLFAPWIKSNHVYWSSEQWKLLWTTKNNYTTSIGCTHRWDTSRWNKYGREYWGTGKRGTSEKRDCHCASSRNLNDSTDVAVTMSSGSLIQYGTTRTMNACWRLRVLHRCWWIFKVWPRSPMRVEAAKTASHGKSRRPCMILYMQIRSPRILLRIRENSCSRWRAVSYGTWRNPFTNFTASFWTLSTNFEWILFTNFLNISTN